MLIPRNFKEIELKISSITDGSLGYTNSVMEFFINHSKLLKRRLGVFVFIKPLFQSEGSKECFPRQLPIGYQSATDGIGGTMNQISQERRVANMPPAMGNSLKIIYQMRLRIPALTFPIQRWRRMVAICQNSQPEHERKGAQEMMAILGIGIVLITCFS